MTTDLSRPAGASAAQERPRPRYAASLQQLLRAQKSAKGAPAYSRFVNRPLGRRLAAGAHVLGMTPNQVTAASAVATGTGIAVIALAPSVWWKGPLVAALLVLGYALDAADGQLARLRGGGSKAGEWLDHVVDAGKIATLHLAVAVGAYLTVAPQPTAWLLVPLGFAAVSTTWFFTIILNDHIRRLAGTRDGQAIVSAGEARQHSALRSLASAPVDYGVLCVVFVLIGWPALFQWAYGLLALGFAVVAGASMVVWYRQVAALDSPVTVSQNTLQEVRA
ncbi:CDP-alcohol phosphatidyltransferase [Quadrisphaera granulorum]|uniref:CDP-alcohol phosphatidyltransferase-like enzyme n=1 Tax=Quadrisphaera granulorum TaxID=317664 RepID=A0A316AGH7_9ACTN|nr:CDP-alcohol phosphatidyltransferase family protein [Quadrisphaera granulorum]PWJ56050.1 CDP-alcohol phosphatidyltransferase-like enzyme [Quadrisphaera granulorum]SZE94684.1 CDP-alcohol phosphatidyltransferase [Quadrisphaera granulorum]